MLVPQTQRSNRHQDLAKPRQCHQACNEVDRRVARNPNRANRRATADLFIRRRLEVMRNGWWRRYDQAPGRLRKGNGHWACNGCRDRNYAEFRYYRAIYKRLAFKTREEYAWHPLFQ